VVCAKSAAPDHPDLHVRYQWGVPKARRLIRVSGISPPQIIVGFDNEINTLERGVKERVFYVKKDGVFVPPPRPLPGHFAATLAQSREQLIKFLPRIAPLSRADFVSTFRGPKRKVYDAAFSSLLRRGFCVKDAWIKVFVKYEKTDFTRKTDPVPRIISPRSARYNIEVGRFLRPLEERIFRSLAKLFGQPTVFKGMNAAQSGRLMRAKWNRFRDPVAVGADASRFDQHVSVEALAWEHAIYLECFPRILHRSRMASLLAMQLENVCIGYTANGRLKYRTSGGRMSGDMNTSLGNCLIMCVMFHAYASHVGVDVELANNGDDCVIIMESRDLGRFSCGMSDWFLAMGFDMVIEKPCYVFEEIEFCQTHPVWVGPDHDSYIMVRHPKWAIAKDTVSVHGWQSEPLYLGWLHAVGTGGMAATGGVPIFQDFYATYLRYGRYHAAAGDGQSWGVRQHSKGMVRQYGDVLPRTRASFYWAFGVTPSEQLILEEFYRSVSLDLPLRSGRVDFQRPMPL